MQFEGELMNVTFQGHRLQFFVRQKGWTKGQFRDKYVALCSELKIKAPSDATMHNWRNGEGEPRYRYAVALGMLFGVPVEAFSGEEKAA